MNITGVFVEIDREKFKLALLNSIINTVLLFLVLHFIFSFTGFPYYINIAISAVFLYLNLNHYSRKYNIRYIERKNPDIDEMLVTARDNIEQENIVTEIFFEKVRQHAKTLSLAKLINLKGLTVRMFAVLVLAIAVIIVQPSEFSSIGLFGFVPGPGIGGVGLYETNDIFGEPRLIELGSEELEINIEPSNNEIDFSIVREPERREFTRNPFPTEAEAVIDTPSNEKIPEDFELIKNYNLIIRGAA